MAPLMTTCSMMDVEMSSCPPELVEVERRNRPRKLKASVSFDNAVRAYRHLHLNDMDQAEHEASWYSQEELDNIKRECHYTAKLVARGKLLPHDDDLTIQSCSSPTSLTFRGLEYRTPDGANLRQVNKETAWDKVLDEQETQYKMGKYLDDDESIARVYQEVSRHCHHAAHLMGLADAYYARQCYGNALTSSCSATV